MGRKVVHIGRAFREAIMAEMFWFGVVDNLLLAVVTVASVYFAGRRQYKSKTLSKMSIAGAALAGAMFGNALSDAAAALSMGLRPTVGVFSGCMIVFIGWPVYSAILRHADKRAA